MPQGETYAVSPIQLSYSPYSMSAVYAAPLVPVSVKFNSAQQGKRRPVWVKVLLQVPWVPTAEDVPCSTREKSSGTHGILQEARLKQTAGQRTKSGQEDYLSGKTMFSLVRLQYDEVIMTHQKRDATKLLNFFDRSLTRPAKVKFQTSFEPWKAEAFIATCPAILLRLVWQCVILGLILVRLDRCCFKLRFGIYLSIIPRTRIGSESIAHEA